MSVAVAPPLLRTVDLVRTYGGYPSLQQYLRGYAIVGDALGSIAHPTRIISAASATGPRPAPRAPRTWAR